MWCKVSEGSDPATTKRPKLRQLAEQRGQHGWADAENGGKQSRSCGQRRVLCDEFGYLAVELVDPARQEGNHGLDLRLTGLRLAISITWVVLVPCGMLGVQSGLGYFILDTRDRLAYPELMATVIAIGVIGYLLDLAARIVVQRHVPGTA